jgi:hypothetical protein
VEAIELNEDEMALIIKRFKTALKGRKEYPNKNKTRGRLVTSKLNSLIMTMIRDKKNTGRERRRRTIGRPRARRTSRRNGTSTAPPLTLRMKD